MLIDIAIAEEIHGLQRIKKVQNPAEDLLGFSTPPPSVMVLCILGVEQNLHIFSCGLPHCIALQWRRFERHRIIYVWKILEGKPFIAEYMEKAFSSCGKQRDSIPQKMLEALRSMFVLHRFRHKP